MLTVTAVCGRLTRCAAAAVSPSRYRMTISETAGLLATWSRSTRQQGRRASTERPSTPASSRPWYAMVAATLLSTRRKGW